MTTKKDNPVGYGKPPKSGQFKKGKSGNPKGRPKGTQNLDTDLMQEMQEKITVKESGNILTISKQRAMIKALVANAIKGNVAAASKLAELMARAEAKNASNALATSESLSEVDQEILQAFKTKILQTAATTPNKESDK